jgi:tRNA (Thr-GGU) A37 N-methylase
MSRTAPGMELTLRPIGVVRNDVSSGRQEIQWEGIVSEIVINPEFEDQVGS